MSRQYRGWCRARKKSGIWKDVAGHADGEIARRRLKNDLARKRFTGFAVLTPPGVKPADREPLAVPVRDGKPLWEIPLPTPDVAPAPSDEIRRLEPRRAARPLRGGL
jgi:hypothetical protein